MFTDPEIAWAGLTETQAKEQGREITVAKFPWAASGRAITLDRPEGLTKLLIDPKTERVLGVGIVGAGAGELIAEGVLAIEMCALAADVGMTIHPHPTLSETMMESAEVFYGQATDIYRPKKDVAPASRLRSGGVCRLAPMKRTGAADLVVGVSLCPPRASRPSLCRRCLNGTIRPDGGNSRRSTDPLGRDTPSGTVLGFLQAAQNGNYKNAADYLQMSAARRQSHGADLAEKLKVLMDRAFVGSLRRLSTRPEGNPDYGTSTSKPSELFPAVIGRSGHSRSRRRSQLREDLALFRGDAQQGSGTV